MIGYLETAGERVAISSSVGWVSELLEEACAGELRKDLRGAPTILVEVEGQRASFPMEDWEPLTRGARRHLGEVVLEDVLATGFDLHVGGDAEIPRFTYRYRPPIPARAAATMLRKRFVLLARSALLQYPALWRAGIRGHAPLHAVACSAGDAVPLLAGPAGVGKSTLVDMEIAAGGVAASDNLSVGDGMAVWGLVEPSRTEDGQGPRTTHGRREGPLARRVGCLHPTALVVVRRGTGAEPALRPTGAECAAASLIAGTYMAGELRRYWAFAGTLSQGTGRGPAHPPVEAVSRRLASRLPAFELHLADKPRPRLADLFQTVEATT